MMMTQQSEEDDNHNHNNNNPNNYDDADDGDDDASDKSRSPDDPTYTMRLLSLASRSVLVASRSSRWCCSLRMITPLWPCYRTLASATGLFPSLV